MALVTMEGCADAPGLDSHLRPGWCLDVAGAILILVACAATRVTGCQGSAISGSVYLLQLGSVMMFMACVATGGH